jgi:hypothetical protein
MRLILFLIIIAFSCSRTERKPIQQFYIGVRNFHGADGVTHYFLLTSDSLKIYVNCDFENCTEKIVYKQRNDEKKISDFEHFLASYRFDSLKTKYENKQAFDFYRTVTIQKNSDLIKTVRLDNYDHPTIDTLVVRIDNLINQDKFKIIK